MQEDSCQNQRRNSSHALRLARKLLNEHAQDVSKEGVLETQNFCSP